MSSHQPAPLRSHTPVRRNPAGMDGAAQRSQPTYLSRVTALPQQVMSPRPTGPVAILWDIENCPVPAEVNAEDVASNIRIALRGHPQHIGAVTMFSAYGDFNQFPKKVREGCQRTGVNLIDVPNGKKDAADKAILVDMFLFALDNPPPSTIFLVTGDVDFAPALHKLGQRGYLVVLAIPDGVGVSSALRGAGRYVWDWPSLCRGHGLVEVPSRPSAQRRSSSVVHNHNHHHGNHLGNHLGNNCHLYTEDLIAGQFPEQQQLYPSNPGTPMEDDDDDDHVLGEEILVQRKPASAPYNGHSSFTSMDGYGQQQQPPYGMAGPRVNTSMPRSVTPAGTPGRVQAGSPGGFGNRAAFPTAEAAPVTQVSAFGQSELALEGNGEPMSPGRSAWVQPGDLAGLKKQLVQLLLQNGGSMTVVKVTAEYSKLFGRPLYLAEYNVLKLVHLLEKMKDTLVVKGEGSSRTLHLKSRTNKYKPSPASKAPKDRDVGSEDSDPEVKDVPEVKEVPVSDVSSVRHLLDMDMDDVKANVFAHTNIDWDPVASDAVKSGKLHDATKTETVIDVGEDCKAEDYEVDLKFDRFKQELQELLVVHAYKIDLKNFRKIYHQRYARDLDLQFLGVDSLDALFPKVKDVAVLKEKIVEGNKGEPRKEYEVVAV